MTNKFFITGTDTNVGKTYISVGLLKAFHHLGYSTIGVKPIASGGVYKNNVLYSEDAMQLNQASSIQLAYKETNPFVFAPAIAPHIAAKLANTPLTLADLLLQTQPAFNSHCDLHIIEGAGGWFLPLNDTETMIDFVKFYQMNIILVVGLRVGCINHAILTCQAIQRENLPIVGWIANHFELSEFEFSEVIATLRTRLNIPYLGSVAFGSGLNYFLKIANTIYSNVREKTCEI